MDSIEIRYRVCNQGLPPQKIKLKMPGWAGNSHSHSTGSEPQPWHCVPFIEGSTYGLELLYSHKNDFHVINDDGKLRFEGDAQSNFDVFASGHYGFTSSLDIVGPPGHIVRLEPHPRYYTDTTWTCPCVVPGHLQTEWWARIFFVVFKFPPIGGKHIFRYREPYAQILILPKKVNYDIYPMDSEEYKERAKIDDLIDKNGKNIAEHSWTDNVGNSFSDKYKVLSRVFTKEGNIEDFLTQ